MLNLVKESVITVHVPFAFHERRAVGRYEYYFPWRGCFYTVSKAIYNCDLVRCQTQKKNENITKKAEKKLMSVVLKGKK